MPQQSVTLITCLFSSIPQSRQTFLVSSVLFMVASMYLENPTIIRSTLSLRSFLNVAFETLPMSI